jgi:hypothetical protein
MEVKKSDLHRKFALAIAGAIMALFFVKVLFF